MVTLRIDWLDGDAESVPLDYDTVEEADRWLRDGFLAGVLQPETCHMSERCYSVRKMARQLMTRRPNGETVLIRLIPS